jgi:nucleotide-binding universal stress UspA family protein
MPDVYDDVVAAAYREAEDYLADVKARLPYDRIALEHRAAEDGVARQILDYTNRSEVDLVVMSSHGRTGVDRWVHGSVAEKVLSGCHCATLIVRCERGGQGQ